MNPKRNALGRGLDSLISFGDVQTDGGSAIREISIDLIQPNPEQPRTTFDEESLDELAVSIRELGIVQPLSLRAADGGKYQIIAGERRWRAARKAGLATVPAYVRTASDSETTEMALIENIQREDLNAIEVALAFRKLIDTYNLTQERLSERLGKKRATISNHLRLLRLPAEIQLGLRDRKLDMGHAKAILSVDDPKQQLKLYNVCVKEGLSVRRVEELAKEWQEALKRGEKPKKANKTAGASSELYDSFRKELSNYFPTPVKFSRAEDGHGSITLRFADDDELMKLVSLFEKLK
ncbi:MAG: ParB/RepB/Spo0J family partition protein [Bacteroidales bacterium]|nr:ParB/RepB/Spo0J family partition protein [Bacteroidales bacterium]MBD5212521.1 ParB/RepB/Spo0J family partition protein [Bacteroidales bacterium]MBD5217985.1 ParB/RepB/Spo0J family partition protein [Bacteroidales bacterium]MBD5222073.1 ParB/RepB/Spo0J family partition protein [Bacteroidales bacterium]